MCFKKGNTELEDKFNAAIKELKEDGTFDKIVGYYIDGTEEKGYESPADVDHSNGKLVMATNAAFEPYEYYEDNKIVGVDVDFAQAIADKLGMELTVNDMEFDSIIAAVDSGKADFGAAVMVADVDARKKLVPTALDLILDNSRLQSLSEHISEMAHFHSAEQIVDEIMRIIERK